MAKILIVDDSEFARLRLQRLFEEGGHEVVACAAYGERALNEYRQHQPELVTMDHIMEDMSGEAAMKGILSLDPQARIIMISGSGDPGLERRTLDAGARAYVEKFNPDVDLLQIVDQVMAD